MRLRSGVAVALDRLATIALIRPLAWEPAYAAGVALKRQKKKEKEIFSNLPNIISRVSPFEWRHIMHQGEETKKWKGMISAINQSINQPAYIY